MGTGREGGFPTRQLPTAAWASRMAFQAQLSKGVSAGNPLRGSSQYTGVMPWHTVTYRKPSFSLQ